MCEKIVIMFCMRKRMKEQRETVKEILGVRNMKSSGFILNTEKINKTSIKLQLFRDYIVFLFQYEIHKFGPINNYQRYKI